MQEEDAVPADQTASRSAPSGRTQQRDTCTGAGVSACLRPDIAGPEAKGLMLSARGQLQA